MSVENWGEKDKLKIELEVHKKGVRCFLIYYKLRRMAQNNPKLNDQAAYFLRQLNVAVSWISHSKETNENTFIYAWTELEGAKGSREIASCVRYRLSVTAVYIHKIYIQLDYLQMEVVEKIRTPLL